MAKASVVFGSVVAVALVVAALWTWQEGTRLVADSEGGPAVLWAVRAAAVAAVALAQGVLLIAVVGNVYRTRSTDLLLRVLTATVFAVSLIGAIALGMAGR